MSMKYYTRGGQITAYNLRMFIQNNKWIAKWLFMGWVLISLAFLILLAGKEELVNGSLYLLIQLAHTLGIPLAFMDKLSSTGMFTLTYHGHQIMESAESIVQQPYFRFAATALGTHLLQAVLIALMVIIGLTAATSRWLVNQGKRQSQSKFIRGARLTDDVRQVARKMRRQQIASDLVISGLPLRKNAEVQNMLIHGTVGTGKSQTIIQLLQTIRARGDKAIIYDKGCSLTPLFYQQHTDCILNPYDQRCAGWDLWAECQNMPDFDNMAESLIPMAGENDPFWVYSARTIFASTAFKMRHDADRCLEKLLQLLLTLDMNQLQHFLSRTEGATLVSEKVEKTAISIRGVLTNYVKALRYMQGLSQQKGFCIKDWLRDDSQSGWLFVSSNAEQHSSIRPLISMWLAMACIRLLGMEENRERRIWFILDELPSLHKLPNLPEIIAEARKFGGCFVIGIQNYPQLENINGRTAAASIFDLLNTRFFFRSPSDEVAQLVEKELDEEEIEDMREQLSYGPDPVRDGVSLGTQRTKRVLVTSSEIKQLDDLVCYVRQPGNIPVVKLQLALSQLPHIAPAFIERNVNDALNDELETCIADNATAFAAVSNGCRRKQSASSQNTSSKNGNPVVSKISEEQKSADSHRHVNKVVRHDLEADRF